MLKVQEIRELIKLVDQSNIDEFVYEHDGSKIQMKKKQAEAVVVQSAPTFVQEVPATKTVQAAVVKQEPVIESNVHEPVKEVEANTKDLHKIVSPMVGTFYQSSSPNADAYVKVGSKVSNDSIVCIVEAMKLFNEIEAEVNGEIVEVLVKDGQLVEYGQPLFLVKAE
ncbi:acetyl-CoA carboxylase biotin carboxyl carrier protein [Cytobacillus depressus]|uniref:Biotin carboxyl carrier protein of acetyl-CoA carboxylase n=1 Tax=Cytobacillus depressus TaxID=1602942 RepID=A0A6L3V9W5_9BACI|nr:acetyl-CoA carboxylase biotin carboxyl carrier protein [Cytobacillus depressus]KAB2338471.1 acetyl-CoA carboxylase biotin carboxyl carrier protein [Cytobacillus depressus]